MTKFKPYPSYKDSGVEWLGDVPEGWEVNPLKYRFKIVGGSTPTSDEQNWDGNIAWATPADLSGLDTLYLKETKRTITSNGLASCATTMLPKNSLILSTRAPIGSLAIIDKPMCTNQGCKGLIPHQNAIALYYAYVLLNAEEELNNRGTGTTFLEISGDELGRFEIPAPPLSEQKQIARFLDYETARIDELIEEQERLIELLEEKRQALISHAVTKGLDPTVPMKDSGVEWLGEVPAHWVVRKVSVDFLASKGPRGAQLTKEYCHENVGKYPVYSGQTENEGILGEIDDFDFDLGDNGAILSTTVGAKAMSVLHIQGRVSLSQNCMIIRPINPNIHVKFFFYHFQPLFYFERRMIPDHMQPSFRMEDLYSFKVAIPPEDEQIQISNYIDQEIDKIEALISEGSFVIILLQERRSALISAAVTGKIDVRDWRPPKGSPNSKALEAKEEALI